MTNVDLFANATSYVDLFAGAQSVPVSTAQADLFEGSEFGPVIEVNFIVPQEGVSLFENALVTYYDEDDYLDELEEEEDFLDDDEDDFDSEVELAKIKQNLRVVADQIQSIGQYNLANIVLEVEHLL